jgi:hypothetical protein
MATVRFFGVCGTPVGSSWGVKLSLIEPDKLRQVVTKKLGLIRPSIDSTSLRLEIYRVENPDRDRDLLVLELRVPMVQSSTPYYTGGNEAFIRLDGIKRKLVGTKLTEWILRRISNDRTLRQRNWWRFINLQDSNNQVPPVNQLAI